MNRLTPLCAALWSLLSIEGCVSSPGERAALDERVGHASISGARLTVENGHAAVRDLAAGALTLWSSTPTWKALLSLDEEATWRITVDNALPDATLRAITTAGEPPVTLVGGERATQRVFEIVLLQATRRCSSRPLTRATWAHFRSR